MVYLTRKEHFNAAHRLYNPAWDDERNASYYGKCSNPNWHGHNYNLFVTVKGEPDPETGYVINLTDLKRIIRERITDRVDHKNLNLEVDFMQGIIPTTENMVKAFWEVLAEPIARAGATLHRIRLYETENNFADYYGN